MRNQYQPVCLLLRVLAPEAYLDVQIVIDLDHLAKDADPLVQVGKVKRISQPVYKGLLLRLIERCAVGLLKRPLS